MPRPLGHGIEGARKSTFLSPFARLHGLDVPRLERAKAHNRLKWRCFLVVGIAKAKVVAAACRLIRQASSAKSQDAQNRSSAEDNKGSAREELERFEAPFAPKA